MFIHDIVTTNGSREWDYILSWGGGGGLLWKEEGL